MDNNFDQAALTAHLRQLEQNIASAPAHILEQVHHAQQIEAHNAQIDKQKAERKKLRTVARQARITLPALKKMLASAKRGA